MPMPNQQSYGLSRQLGLMPLMALQGQAAQPMPRGAGSPPPIAPIVGGAGYGAATQAPDESIWAAIARGVQGGLAQRDKAAEMAMRQEEHRAKMQAFEAAQGKQNRDDVMWESFAGKLFPGQYDQDSGVFFNSPRPAPADDTVGQQVALPQQQQMPPPNEAIQMLMGNPSLAPLFDQKYGPGAAQQYIRGGAGDDMLNERPDHWRGQASINHLSARGRGAMEALDRLSSGRGTENDYRELSRYKADLDGIGRFIGAGDPDAERLNRSYEILNRMMSGGR